ncbi:MAG: hypothetical protein C4325_13500 [Blastocatellia bacterium]|mgnify:CR=1 FL=1
MKKLAYLFVFVALAALSVQAQYKPDFSGKWNLDVANSKLDQRMRIESMTLTVSQTDKELSVTTSTKRLPPNDTMGGGRGIGGDGTTVYSLDGKETKTEMEGPMGKMPVAIKAKLGADGILKISSTRTFNGPMGEISMTTNETWKLSADGKILTIERETSSPRGQLTTTLVFTKG